MFFNRQQIIEHSKGAEGLFTGDSEFRKATLILMFTWIPFPCWFMLSPEGLGAITNITIIQMGWAILNIISKFTLTFYLQRVKDNYGHRLKVKRAVEKATAQSGQKELCFSDDEDEAMAQDEVAQGDLGGCVTETMTFLGMAENTDRFLRLLKQARVHSLDDAARLTRQDCENLQLPYDLVTAVQKRHKVWALEMVDDAETGLVAGEKYYKIDVASQPALANAPTRALSREDTSSPQNTPRTDVQPSYRLGSNTSPVRPSPKDGTADRRQVNHPPNPAPVPHQQFAPVPYQQLGAEQMELEHTELLDKKFEAFESRLLEKIGHVVERAAKQSTQEMQASMENSQVMFESKIEHMWAMQCKQQREDSHRDMNAHMDKVTEKMLQCTPTASTGAATLSVQPVEHAMKDINRKLEAIQEKQQANEKHQSVSSRETSDGWVHQIIQGSKVAAFTLQSKLVAMEETQNRKHGSTGTGSI
jgi:hypothetical protein